MKVPDTHPNSHLILPFSLGILRFAVAHSFREKHNLAHGKFNHV